MTTLLIVACAISACFLAGVLIKFDFSRIILLLVFLRPFLEGFYELRLGSISGYEMNPLSLWGALMILLLSAYWLLQKKNPFELKNTKWIALFIGSLLIGGILSTGVEAIINQLLKALPWMLLIPVVADMCRTTEPEKILRLFYTALVAFITVNGLSLLTGAYRSGYYQVGEFYGYFKGPQAFSYTLLFLLPYAVYALRTRRKKSVPLTVFLITCLLIIFAYVRTTWVALLVGVSAFLYLEPRLSKKAVALILLGSFFLVSLAYFKPLVEPAFQARTEDIRESIASGSFQALGSGRIGFWEIQLRRFFQGTLTQQLFGKGLGVITEITFAESGMPIGGHNDYIDLLIGSGLFSCVLYMIFQATLFHRAFFLYRSGKELLGQLGLTAMATLVTVGLLSGIIYSQTSIYVAVLMGIVLHLTRPESGTSLRRFSGAEESSAHGEMRPMTGDPSTGSIAPIIR
jgi:O-antigen ligase